MTRQVSASHSGEQREEDISEGDMLKIILSGAIKKAVSEKLGILIGDMEKFIEGMSTQNTTKAKLMILQMIRDAADEFYLKIESRINAKKR